MAKMPLARSILVPYVWSARQAALTNNAAIGCGDEQPRRDNEAKKRRSEEQHQRPSPPTPDFLNRVYSYKRVSSKKDIRTESNNQLRDE